MLLILVGAAACTPAAIEIAPVVETIIPSLTTSPTGTIDWFPATSTFTPAPTQAITTTPTPELGLGETLLTDNFSEPGQWSTFKNSNGSAAYGKNEFTLAVSTPKGYITSLRSQPILSDFYLEISVNPSLCSEGDSYGLLLRAANEWSYYRYVITCDGQVRLERVKDSFAVLVQDWLYSAQIRPGPEADLHIGVWMYRDQMRFFIDGIEQFTARDPVWTNGSLGFFARAGGETPLTVNFSDLSVRAINPSALPTRTPLGTTSVTP
jgi:hypothetical protein